MSETTKGTTEVFERCHSEEVQTSFERIQSLDDSVFVSSSEQIQKNADTEHSICKPGFKLQNSIEVVAHHFQMNYMDNVRTNCEDTAIASSSIILLNEPKTVASHSVTSSQQVCFGVADNHNAEHKCRKIDHSEVEDSVFPESKEKELHLASSNELPITCKKNHAILHKDKLGSGKKGKCIIFEKKWYTPSEFENLSGLKMSRDWKRSLRYAGRSMQNLINDGSLRPHAATCTCAVCCNDETLTGPVRYFTPNAKRKRGATTSLTNTLLTSVHDGARPSTAPPVQRPPQPLCLLDSETPAVNSKLSCFTLPTKLATLEGSSDVLGEARPLIEALIKNERQGQRIWEKLEKKVEIMAEKFRLLQESIQNAKKDCEDKRNDLLEKITIVLQNQKNNGVSNTNFAKQSSESFNGIFNEKLAEDLQDEEDATEICHACGRQANSECTGCRKATYCSTECQEKDWNAGHRNICRQLASDS